ncbi:ArsR/SmtB family transcription factor [Halorubrum tibetense]|uniref:ArsR/SmtB family transcription factor n=1 Tax=Halorubrum tibetense TaxID=175631 RepID=A0ABD5SC99_9EURY
MSRLLPSLPDSTPDDRDPRVVGVDDDEAKDLIAALGSETARNVLSALHDEPATTSELADELDTSLQNVQYHLSKLSDADVVDVVDTTYSEKGREMNVYAPTDEPLVLFAGGADQSHGIKTALKRLLGGYGVIGLAALAAQAAFSSLLPDVGLADDAPATTEDGAATDDVDDVGVATEDPDEPTDDAEAAPEPDEEFADVDASVEDTGYQFREAAGESELLTELAATLSEPGVVFFLGAALVFTLAWLAWYRGDWGP